MYYLVTTDDDNRCQSYTFGTKEALTDEVNLLSQRNEYVEIIVQGKELNMEPVEVVKKWKITSK